MKALSKSSSPARGFCESAMVTISCITLMGTACIRPLSIAHRGTPALGSSSSSGGTSSLSRTAHLESNDHLLFSGRYTHPLAGRFRALPSTIPRVSFISLLIHHLPLPPNLTPSPSSLKCSNAHAGFGPCRNRPNLLL